MKKMVCKICGSSNIIKKDGVFVCQTCGMQYSVDDAKKLLKEVDELSVVEETTTKIDSSSDSNLDNLYKLARRARKNDDNEAAAKYYETISVQRPDDWEALFYSAYCRATQIKVGEIPNTMITFSKTALSTLDLINETSENLTDIRSVVKEVSDLYGSFMMSLYRQGLETNGGSVDSNVREYLPLFADKLCELFPDYKEFAYELYEIVADLYKEDVLSDDLDVWHPRKGSYMKYSSEEAKKRLANFIHWLKYSDGEPSKKECEIATEYYNKMQEIEYKEEVNTCISEMNKKVEELKNEIQIIKDEWNHLIANPTDKQTTSVYSGQSPYQAADGKKLASGFVLLFGGIILGGIFNIVFLVRVVAKAPAANVWSLLGIAITVLGIVFGVKNLKNAKKK